MNNFLIMGLALPFLGTSLGSMCVLFMKNQIKRSTQEILSGFAAGVMIAATIWSLIIPSIDQSKALGKLAFVPAVSGFCVGMIFILILDHFTPHIHPNKTKEGPQSSLKDSSMMVLAVVLHNIPEGMAAGVVYAAILSGSVEMSKMAALALSIGIAIQNFPEGAIVSMPLSSYGESKWKACLKGILSGIVEPIAALITIYFSNFVVPILPYLLGFAAGAMMYVVVDDLIPDMTSDKHKNSPIIAFMLGFCLMMILDIALG